MRPIWFFVGLLLVVNGFLVVTADIVFTINPPDQATVLAHLRPGLWWGALMIAGGLLFLITNRRKIVNH